jgi:hypothetical protein
MNRLPLRYLATVAVLALAGTTTAACGPAPVSPLPGQAATASGPSVSAPTDAPSPSTNTGTLAQQGNSSSSSPPPACIGATTFEIDGADSADIPRSLCFEAGGVLRVSNVDPPAVSGTPAGRVSCVWEAGISNCRFLTKGNATVTVVIDGHPKSITVVVVS